MNAIHKLFGQVRQRRRKRPSDEWGERPSAQETEVGERPRRDQGFPQNFRNSENLNEPFDSQPSTGGSRGEPHPNFEPSSSSRDYRPHHQTENDKTAAATPLDSSNLGDNNDENNNNADGDDEEIHEFRKFVQRQFESSEIVEISSDDDDQLAAAGGTRNANTKRSRQFRDRTGVENFRLRIADGSLEVLELWSRLDQDQRMQVLEVTSEDILHYLKLEGLLPISDAEEFDKKRFIESRRAVDDFLKNRERLTELRHAFVTCVASRSSIISMELYTAVEVAAVCVWDRHLLEFHEVGSLISVITSWTIFTIWTIANRRILPVIAWTPLALMTGNSESAFVYLSKIRKMFDEPTLHLAVQRARTFVVSMTVVVLAGDSVRNMKTGVWLGLASCVVAGLVVFADFMMAKRRNQIRRAVDTTFGSHLERVFLWPFLFLYSFYRGSYSAAAGVLFVLQSKLAIVIAMIFIFDNRLLALAAHYVIG